MTSCVGRRRQVADEPPTGQPLLLRIEARPEGAGVCVLRIEGELDVATAEQVRDAVLAAGGSTVVVDLTGLSFLDARGLAALLAARKAAQHGGRAVRLRGAHGIVRRVFDVVGCADLLDDEIAEDPWARNGRAGGERAEGPPAGA